MAAKVIQNKILLIVLLTSIVWSVSACTGKTEATPFLDTLTGGQEAPQNSMGQYILMAHTEAEDSQTHKAAERFRLALEEVSGGQMSVEIYSNIALGNTKGSSLILDGGVDVGIGIGPSTSLKIAQWLPVLRNMDREQVIAALSTDGALRPLVEEECAAAGVHILGFMPVQVRFLAGTKKVVSPGDLAELTVRSIPSLTGDEALWRSLGANLMGLELSELYFAVQQGQVEVQANTLEFFADYRLYEQERYSLDTNHELYIRLLMTSESFFQSLSPEQQSWLEEAAQQMLDWITEQAAYEEEWTAFLTEYGVQFTHLPDDLRSEWMDAMRPTVRNNLEQRYGQDAVEQILALL